MSKQTRVLQEATIKQHCKVLRMPAVASQFVSLAEQAVKENQNHYGYLEALLTAEVEERERNTIERRIREAHLPRVKTLQAWFPALFSETSRIRQERGRIKKLIFAFAAIWRS